MPQITLTPEELRILWYVCNNAQSQGLREITSLTSSDRAYLLSRTLPMWAHETQEEFDVLQSIKAKSTTALNSMSLPTSDTRVLDKEELAELQNFNVLRDEYDVSTEEETNPVAPSIDEEELQE